MRKDGAARKAALWTAAVLGLGAAGIAAAQNAPSQAPAPAHKARHGNWDVFCTKTAGKENCQAVQTLEARKPEQAESEAQRVLRLIAQKGPDGTVLSFELPFGLDLRPGIVYQVDAGAEATVPFLTCMPSGCVASIVLKDDARKQVAGGKQMKVGFRPLGSEKVVVVDVALDGVDKALAAL